MAADTVPRPVVPRSEKTLAFRVMAFVAIPWLTLMVKLRLHDTGHLPKTGPFVLSPNHYSNIDPLIMGWAVWRLGRAPRFLAKASLFRVPVVGFALRRSGQIPVERGGAGRGNQPFAAANSLVEHGRGVIVYPEGTLTRDPDLWPMRGKTGAVRIALENDVPLIPMAHWGTQNIMARYGKKLRLFPPSRVDVIIGDPVDLSAYRGRQIDQQMLGEATELVMREITALLEVLRGERAPATRWDPAANNQKETGRFE